MDILNTLILLFVGIDIILSCNLALKSAELTIAKQTTSSEYQSLLKKAQFGKMICAAL